MDDVAIREARDNDAAGIAAVLQALVAADKRSKPSDADFALSYYINGPHQILCSVAVGANAEILGFQSLKHATEGNPYEVKVGWGIIGTHINLKAARRGIGKTLFKVTQAAARAHGVPAIDATIGARNAEGLAYYEAKGFCEYRRLDGAISKVFQVG